MEILKRLCRRAGGILIVFMLCLVCFQQSVCAADQQEQGKITVRYSAVKGVEFRVYFVGEITEEWKFVLTGAFRDIPADLNDLDTEEMTALADTLASYAEADRIEADYSGITDEKGEIIFTNLSRGLYLITGESSFRDGVCYEPVPFLITVPSADADGNWTYETAADVKYETSVPSEEEIQYRVMKYWSGDGDGQTRPDQITVDIMKDGELYETQILSEANNWTYWWTAVDDGSSWTVVEREIPDSYTVRIERTGTVFQLTNTYTGESGGESPSTGDTSVPMFMITLLSASGVIMILTGLVVRNRKEKQDV